MGFSVNMGKEGVDKKRGMPEFFYCLEYKADTAILIENL